MKRPILEAPKEAGWYWVRLYPPRVETVPLRYSDQKWWPAGVGLTLAEMARLAADAVNYGVLWFGGLVCEITFD